ncbi:MAG: D-alanyl-D-alanine carboxypeptidase [Defluviitaleaceae bacterium]|nr:D-alanyl-D-alanine carboxypeptidase [Defluviitaleaceae bacterium]
MRKLMCFLLSLIILMSGTVAAFAEEVKEPTVEAHAAILMDAKTGRILWEKEAYKPLAMASTTKIMTAVLALESGKQQDTVTVSKAAAAAPRMKMHLTTGEKISLRNLLLALMLESSNDAAVAIAEHLGGSVEEFCAMMTNKAKEIGAKDTLFETPNGLDAGNHHSTAYDLAMIAKYALEVPGFIELTNTETAKFSSNKREYSMVNKNRLLREFKGANGVKTGFTNKAGHCFVGAAKRDDMQLISVVLGSGWGDRGRKMKWVDTKAVLNYGFDNYEYEIIIHDEDLAGNTSVTRSRTNEMEYIYESELLLPLNQNKKEPIEIKLVVPDSIQAPISKGEIIGHAEIYINGKLYASIDLSATEEALRHDFKTSLEKVINQWICQVTEEPVQLILPEFPELPDLPKFSKSPE